MPQTHLADNDSYKIKELFYYFKNTNSMCCVPSQTQDGFQKHIFYSWLLWIYLRSRQVFLMCSPLSLSCLSTHLSQIYIWLPQKASLKYKEAQFLCPTFIYKNLLLRNLSRQTKPSPQQFEMTVFVALISYWLQKGRILYFLWPCDKETQMNEYQNGLKWQFKWLCT